ncbi:hypothetical protein ACFVHB_38615 [Kitasatospora sp. NPDC127111]|uniref:hypothetical protein n=1 Tax=Kitasatospora sp. NPDC127111 TaxID=3345363 RepID=UPI0036378DB7
MADVLAEKPHPTWGLAAPPRATVLAIIGFRGREFGMGELRGGYRAHFVLALVLGGADMLCMASTWLPGGYTVPKWLVMGLLIALFPVLAVALFRALRPAWLLLGRGNGDRFIRYVLALPPVLKLTYALVIAASALGFATGAGAAEDVRADASGYYYTYWDTSSQPQHSSRVDLTEPAYHAALKSQLRIFSAGPTLFYALSSFLVLASASSAAARARTAPRRSSGSAKRPGRS